MRKIYLLAILGVIFLVVSAQKTTLIFYTDMDLVSRIFSEISDKGEYTPSRLTWVDRDFFL